MRQRTPITLEPLGFPWVMVVLVHGLLGAAIWWGVTRMDWSGGNVAQGAAESLVSEPALHWGAPSDYRLESGTADRAVAAQAKDEANPEMPGKPVEVSAEKVPTVAESATMLAEDLDLEPQRQSPAPEMRPANRFITLSRLTSDLAEPPAAMRTPPGGRPVKTLLDIATAQEGSSFPGSPGSSTTGDYTAALDDIDAAVQEAFLKNWVAPEVTKVDPQRRSAHLEVSIGRDGTILGTMLARPSGSAELDGSIEDAAGKVKKIPLSLPAGFRKPFYELQVNFQID